MTRIHLVQMEYKPAYADAVDSLSLPHFPLRNLPDLGISMGNENLQELLLDIKSEYLSHIDSKLKGVLKYLASRKSNIIVFPEYSVPVTLLEYLKDFSKKHNVIIIAGTHKVLLGEQSKKIYTALGILEKNLVNKAALCPIIMPDRIEIIYKSRKSIYENDLETVHSDRNVFDMRDYRFPFDLRVNICVEAIADCALDNSNERPIVSVCTALSPSTSYFADRSSLENVNGNLFLFCNHATTGKSFVALPRGAEDTIGGDKAECEKILTHEAIIEFDIHSVPFAVAKSTTKSDSFCSMPRLIPICYQDTEETCKELENCESSIKLLLQKGEIQDAINQYDDFALSSIDALPPIQKYKLDYLRNMRFSSYNCNEGDVSYAFEHCLLYSCNNTKSLYYRHTKQLHDVCVEMVSDPNIDTTFCRALNELFVSLKPAVKEYKKFEISDSISTQITPSPIIYDSDLAERFHNRGTPINTFQEFINNPELRTVFIRGTRGIGKTEFVKLLFVKKFTDWKIFYIKVVPSGFTRVIAEISHQLGIPLDIDTFDVADEKVVKRKIRKILKSFFSESKRFLVIDDIGSVLSKKQSKNNRLIETFLSEINNITDYRGGRIVIVSSFPIPSRWYDNPYSRDIILKNMQNDHISKMIIYNMRKQGLLRSEHDPKIPESILDAISGHPLTAKLFVDYSQTLNIEIKDIHPTSFSRYAIDSFLEKISLSSDEEMLLTTLSVFRLPIDLNLFSTQIGTPIKSEVIETLQNKGIFSCEKNFLETQGVFRQYYYEKIRNRASAHLLASKYYDEQIKGKRNSEISPDTKCELIFHKAMSNCIDKNNSDSIIVTEVYQTARQLYKESEYRDAIRLFKTLETTRPNNCDILAYIGRCNARLANFGESDEYFEKAIEAKKRQKPCEVWYLYRDWAQIDARFNRCKEANEHIRIAQERLGREDASIETVFAFLCAKEHDEKGAIYHYERALEIDQYHEFTLSQYLKYLRKLGENKRIQDIEERMKVLQDSGSVTMSEYDMEDNDE